MTNWYRQLINKWLEATLKNIDASFIQISRKEFLSSQRFIRMRSMVYKSEELELTCRESQVKSHSLCYIRTNNKPKLYYAASTTFRIPPSELEGQTLHWFSTHKGQSPKEQNTLSNLHRKNLFDAKLKEEEACSEDFKQQIHDFELSSFSLGLNFLPF